jgi:exodeoxyribonuclease VII large subunit
MMTQLTFIEPQYWSVSGLTRYLRNILESDPALADLWVQGEVSNTSRPGSGHFYFTLKDSACSIRCVMWRNSVIRQSFIPQDGQAIEAHGSISIYEAGGQYQLYADILRPAGEGALYQEFLRLKARLEAEGLFDQERKRPIPPLPQTIGLITSPTGAALRDILNTLQRRYPLAEVIIAPTQVQGDDAPPGIVAALESMVRYVKPDLILLARGGGSIEDLWAFNDERVARAIAASSVPVISGIGHETDFTIADFVSDLRAPTPTAAAELATPNRYDLEIELSRHSTHLLEIFENDLNNRRWILTTTHNKLMLHSPQALIRSGRQRLDEQSRRLSLVMIHRLQMSEIRLAGITSRLASLNPDSVLLRGYAILTGHDGRTVSSVQRVHSGDTLNARLYDGTFNIQVLDDPTLLKPASADKSTDTA